MNLIMSKIYHHTDTTIAVIISISLAAAAANAMPPASTTEAAEQIDKLLIVDCLLPGQLRKLGAGAMYLSPRQPVKTSAADCEIRGGEYVAYDRANYGSALKIWLPLANNGDKQAQTYVGEIFEKGLGMAPDYQVAATWYRRAADQGYARALVNLGFLYEKGMGVGKDPTAALNLYRRAAGMDRSMVLDDDSEGATQKLSTEVSTLQRLLAETRHSLDTANADRVNTEAARGNLSRERTAAELRNDTAGVHLFEARLAERDKELREQRAELQRLQRQALLLSDELDRTKSGTSKQNEDNQRTLNARDLEIRRRDEDIAKLSHELTQLRSYKVKLEAERQRIDESRRTLSEQKNAATKANEQHRASLLDSQLKQQEAELERRRDQGQRLEKELERSREIIAKLESAVLRKGGVGTPASLPAPLAPPSIQLIDPQLVVARGSTSIVSIQPGVKTRDLVGRVVAAAGLMSLTVNDRRQPVEENGLFKTSIEVQAGQTPVQIVAVDRQGQRVMSQFLMSSGDALAATRPVAKPPVRSIEFGKYYALVIGNGEYKKVARLETAVADANDVGQLLESKFGFKVTLLLNATRYQILTELNRLRASLTEKDNLLIYYAGHGELDRANLRGHWLPIDAEPDSDANWISTVAVTDILNAMSVKHALVISDSCYSGAMTRSSIGRLDAGMSDEARVNWLKSIASVRSRTVMTSGGLQPVADGGGGKHSVFAKSFIEVLTAVSEVIEAQLLYHEISARVLNAALKFKLEQRPEYAPMRFAGHESGDFLFVPKN